MNEFIKKNISIIIAIFILIQPILDLLTGLCVHWLQIDITFGIIVRILFLAFICIITLFVFKKKNILIPYFIIGLYIIFYCIGMILYNEGSVFQEIQGLAKTFYFPILFISLYLIRDNIRISKMTLFTTLFLYLILIFIPLLLGIGYQTYEITKEGTLGFFNAANEISGIISLLTPIMLLVFVNSKKTIPIVILSVMYLVVILMIGTKTPLLSLSITLIMGIIYLWINSFKKKKYKNIFISFGVVLVCVVLLTIFIPKTNFYKNIETHLHYLKLNNVAEVFKDKQLVDHFIFSQRLTFLHDKALLYKEAPIYQKLFGIGYTDNGKETKLIEMDYFDIFYSHGIIGFIVFFIVTLYVLYKVLERSRKLSFDRYMLETSLILIIFLSFFTGHILTAPSVGLLSMILILSLRERQKKDLLFTSFSMDIGGIETALLNLVNRIDQSKYNVTIILEEKKGIFLNKINKEITVNELKVSNNKNTIIRKLTNYSRKLFFKIINYQNYDFSCCYATYSYSSSKLALIASDNTAFYVHNDYRTIYKDIDEFKYFFDSRDINNYRNIIFVSNENKEGFIEVYKKLKSRCKVYNNFIDTENIKKLSEEKLEVKKANNKLFVYVGRLDDNAKKISRQINLVKEIKDITLWIIGDGQDKEKYQKQVKENNLEDRVIFFGKQKNPYKYMKQADYIILTSDYEGFPVTYLEAITLNKNIITTFPTSDDKLDINEYGNVISKDRNKMIKEVKDIIKNKKSPKEINLEECQNIRMQQLEKMFEGR